MGRSITAVPIEIDSSAMNLRVCDLDPAKASAALLNVAKRLEAERRGKKKPITLVYRSTSRSSNKARR